MICPRCRYEQPEAKECIKCGVVIDKYIRSNIDELTKSDNTQSKDKPYKQLYNTGHEVPHVSTGHKILVFSFIALMLAYIGTVYLNNHKIKKTIQSEITKAYETNLKNELQKNILNAEIVKICNKNEVVIQPDDITIKFMYENDLDNQINYTININVPYTERVLGFDMKTDIDVTVKDSMPNDGNLKIIRLRELFKEQ